VFVIEVIVRMKYCIFSILLKPTWRLLGNVLYWFVDDTTLTITPPPFRVQPSSATGAVPVQPLI